MDCFVQHTSKIRSHYQQHVFALVDWYVEGENKIKYDKLVEIWRKTFIPGGPSRLYLPVSRIFSKLMVASTHVFEGKVVIVSFQLVITSASYMMWVCIKCNSIC